MSKWSREDYEKVLNLRQEGHSFQAIARDTGIPRTTVQRWAKGENKPWLAWTAIELLEHGDKVSSIQDHKKRGKRISSSGRRRARRVMRYEPKTCYFCEGSEPRKWVVHHIDGNESNNARDNLAWAHESCNKSYHTSGRVLTQETKDKISQSRKNWWRRKQEHGL